LLLTNSSDVNARDNSGQTPLHAAAQSKAANAMEMLKLLVDAGAELLAEDSSGRTAFGLASGEAAKFLKDAMLREQQRFAPVAPTPKPVSVAAVAFRRPPSGHRPRTLAIWQLTCLEGASKNVMVPLTETLRDALSRSGWFRIIARGDMAKVLREQDIALSTVCDTTDCAVEYGQLLSAEKMVVGSVSKIGSTHQVVLKLIDVGTGGVDNTGSARKAGADDVLFDLVQRAAADLVR